MQRQPDITRAREVLDWEPQVTLRDGLVKLLDGTPRAALVGSFAHAMA
jgi:nucleoside-diphosphate-sugar epimerase